MNNSNTSIKRNYCMDTLKGFACIAVVLIHFNWGGTFSTALKAACRFAVPYFMFVSGFYLTDSKGVFHSNKLGKKIMAITKMLLASGAFYAVFCVVFNLLKDKSWNIKAFMAEKLNKGDLVRLVLNNDPLQYDHLWYLMALICIYLLMYITGKLFATKPKLTLVTALLLMGYFTLLSELRTPLGLKLPASIIVSGTDKRLWFTNLFFVRALPFFLVGMFFKWLSLNREKHPALTPKKLVAIIAAGAVLSVVETTLAKAIQFYAGSYVMLFAMAYLATYYPQIKSGYMHHIGRDLSMYIYIFHIAVGRSIELAYSKFKMNGNYAVKMLRPVIILLATLLVAEIIYYFKTNSLKDMDKKVKRFGLNMDKHRFIFEELVKRDFKQKYKRTVLGMGWSLLSPLLQLLVMSVVFKEFFGRTVAHFTIYLFSGNLIFNYFKESTNGGMRALVGNSSIFSKVNVPKYLFLLSKNVSALINFALTLLIYMAFVIVDGIEIGPHFLALIYPIVCLVVLNIGLGLILSAVYVFFRDLSYLYDIFTLLLMYMSAIFYTIDAMSRPIKNMFYFNPVYCYITYFRTVVISGTIPPVYLHVLCALYAVVAVGIGAIVYKKYNHKFLYYV